MCSNRTKRHSNRAGKKHKVKPEHDFFKSISTYIGLHFVSIVDKVYEPIKGGT